MNLLARCVGWLVFLAWSVSAFAAPQPAVSKGYLLGAGDVVRITVYGHPDLTVEARVSEADAVSFPLIGEIRVGGSTPPEAESRIASALEQGEFVKQPQVQLIVVQYRSQQVSVLGQVNKPGRYAIETATRLSDMLATAGGINGSGGDTVVLTRTRDGKTERREIDTVRMLQNGKLGDDVDLAGGDIIFVPRAPVFYIYGEVQHPGAFRLEKDMTVMQALSVGGGLTQRGTDRRIRIKRMEESSQVRTLDAELTDPVRQDDVIFVREALF